MASISNKTRIIHLDLLRIAATFTVVVLHTAAQNWYSVTVSSSEWQVLNVYDSLARWSVPVFFMISGALLLGSTRQPSNNFLAQYKKIAKKILKILAALFFWGIFYQLFNQLVTHTKPISMDAPVVYLVRTIIRIFFASPWDHLWFLYIVIGLYTLTPLLQNSIISWGKTGLKTFIGLFFIFGTCLPLINLIASQISKNPSLRLAFSVPELSGYLGYYVTGYYLSKYQLQRKAKGIIFALAGISVVGTVVGTSLWSLASNIANSSLYDYLLPNTFFMAVAIFIFCKNWSHRWQRLINAKQKKFIANISQNTFGIYLIHDIFLQILKLLGVNTLTFHPAISVSLLATVSFLLSLLCTQAIKKIPVLGKYIV